MTDLNALREQIADETSAKMEYDMQWQRDLIEAALLQYAEAVLGEPSEGMLDVGCKAVPLGEHRQLAPIQSSACWTAMASQRLKEIK